MTPRCPTPCATATAPPWPPPCWPSGPQRSLVPVPAAGWRNVGQALHADTLTDAEGTLQVRASAHRPAGPGAGRWAVAGRRAARMSAAARGQATVDLTTVDDGLRRRYRVRHADHAAWVNGPEGQSTFVLRTSDDADERGGVAGECRAPLPGAVTKVLVSLDGHRGGG